MPPGNSSQHYQSGFSLTQVRSVFNGTETITVLGPKIWNLVLLVINQNKYVNVFLKCFFKHFISLISCMIKISSKLVHAFSSTLRVFSFVQIFHIS